MLDEVSEFTGDIMGKLTNLDVEDKKAMMLVNKVIRDELFREIIREIKVWL